MIGSVSVVVPTHRRPERLAACLEGVRSQARPAQEVLVVLHRSDEPTASLIRQLAPSWPELRAVQIGRHGLVAASNAGLAAADGDIVAYVDDDAVPAIDWLERLVETFERDERIAAVGGRDIIMPNGRGPGNGVKPRGLMEAPTVGRIQWWGRMLGNHHIGVGSARDVDVLKGANMSFRRSAVAGHGFDERLVGEGAQVHVELSICLPLRRRGLRIVYDPAIVVNHFPAFRPRGPQRGDPADGAAFATAHNEALQVLDYFGPTRRMVFAAWGLLVGTTDSPGLAVTARDALAPRPAAWSRFRASQRGRAAAWKTRGTPRAALSRLPSGDGRASHLREGVSLRHRQVQTETKVAMPTPALRITLAAPSFGVYGGVQAVMLAIARFLADEGIEVRLCFKLVGGAQVVPSFRDVLTSSGFDCTVTTQATTPSFLRALRWADVVHVHTPSPDICALARLLRRPVAVTVYNHKPEGDNRRLGKSRAAMALAQRNWFISTFVGATWGMTERPPRFEKAPTVADLPIGVVPPAARRGFVSIARLIPNKGLDDLVRAYARAHINCGDQPLTIVGDGPLKPSLIDLAAANGVAEHVSFPGFVDAPTRDALIRHARWLVAPANTKEDLGLTPIEARHVEVPCIVTRDGGLPEAGGSEALLSEPGDVTGLARSLEAASEMSAEEYAARSERTRRELIAYLRPLSWFSDRYRDMARARRRSPGGPIRFRY